VKSGVLATGRKLITLVVTKIDEQLPRPSIPILSLSLSVSVKQLVGWDVRYPVAFDDLKKFQGQVYSGMSIGGTHVWDYPHGVWQEQKVAPDRWVFSFRSGKKRVRKAPEGSGALPGTQYHWFILAHQRVRKVDQDTYETVMQGVKYKIAHKRPHWRHWSTEYPDNEPEREILIRILEQYLAELKAGTPLSG